MADRPGHSKPVHIFTSQSDHSLNLDVEALKRVLLADRVKNKPVVVISVAGAFRKGKSFLLNFFIRYLANQCKSDWLNNCDATLDGFAWRGGSERATTGILLWSEVFVVSTPQGEVAVVLMDTQGTFDRKSTMKETGTIFALSTMLSSVQVYNVKENIAEDDLQNLQLFCDYGQLVQKEVSNAPFQQLLFLVRDWSFPYEFSYGEQGGREYLKDLLQSEDDQPDELRRLRRDIKSSFQDITCFLMPHPGLNVATDPEFKGRISDIDIRFREYLQKLVAAFIHPDKLQPKTVNGVNMTCEVLCTHVQVYAEAFAKGNIPGPKSMREATGVANNVSALVGAVEKYMNGMNTLCGGTSVLTQEEIFSSHQEHRTAAVQMFDGFPKLGGRDLEQLYRGKLLETIDTTFKEFERRNNQKGKKVQMTALFWGIFMTVGIAVLSAPFSPAALAASSALRLMGFLPGFGMTLASSILAEQVGTAIAPCEEGPVVSKQPDDLLDPQSKAGKKE